MKLIDQSLLSRLHHQAVAAPRLRTHHNLHTAYDEDIQRMCMAMEPGTYIRPHRHPDKPELLLIISGEMAVLTFDDTGKVLNRTVLSAGGPVYGLENPEGAWHGVVTLTPATVVLEVKHGPYVPTAQADFAAWAPPEGHARAAEFERWYRTAQPGDTAPVFTA